MLTVVTAHVVVETVLLQTDAPDLVLARDVFGAAYLCSLVKIDRDGHWFLAVQISPGRLADLRAGTIDLRTVLTEPEGRLRFWGCLVPSSTSERPAFRLEAVQEVPEAWLPDEGLFLSDFTGEVEDDEVVQQAMRRNAVVVVCRLNPPEAQGMLAKVDADRLADCIRGFQSLVRHATKTSQRHRIFHGGDDASVLQVVGFSPGSFNVHFESKMAANLMGTSAVGAAMQRIDDLMALAMQPPDEQLKGFRRNQGHVLAAYENLLKLIAHEEAPFQYRWSEPSMAAARGFSVSPTAARALCAVLQSKETLKNASFSFEGRFTSVNTDKKPWSWVARDSSNKIRRGFVHEKHPTALDGVTIKTESYVLTGEERLVKVASGRQLVQLFLTSAR